MLQAEQSEERQPHGRAAGDAGTATDEDVLAVLVHPLVQLQTRLPDHLGVLALVRVPDRAADVFADAAGASKLGLLLLLELVLAEIGGVEDAHDGGDAAVLQRLVVGGVPHVRA